MDLGAEDLSAGRHGSQVTPDDDDDEHDDHDDNDKINDTEGVDPERLKAFNVSQKTLGLLASCLLQHSDFIFQRRQSVFSTDELR